jgi:hypothetical protein
MITSLVKMSLEKIQLALVTLTQNIPRMPRRARKTNEPEISAETVLAKTSSIEPARAGSDETGTIHKESQSVESSQIETNHDS